MFAITTNGIGKPVTARAILPDADLMEGESFKSESWEFGDVLDSDGASLRTPLAEDPVAVPSSVTRFQARAALHLNPSLHEGFETMLDEVEAFMAGEDVDPLAKLAWTDAQEFKRQSPTILGIAPLLGLDEDDLDNLFIIASGIDA